MKGHRKRKGSLFPIGNQYRAARIEKEKAKIGIHQPSTSTASTQELETVDQRGTSTDCTAQHGRQHDTSLNSRRLRRRTLKNTSVSPSRNRIINITKMVDMMNYLYKRHKVRSRIQTSCLRLKLVVVKEVKKDSVWQYQFTTTTEQLTKCCEPQQKMRVR